jgi:hypothetical protein
MLVLCSPFAGLDAEGGLTALVEAPDNTHSDVRNEQPAL